MQKPQVKPFQTFEEYMRERYSDREMGIDPIETQFGSIPQADWYEIISQSKKQLDQSRQFKSARMRQIKQNEDLYQGIGEKEYKNPYDYCYPYMAGFVDQLMGDIDEPPAVNFEHTKEASYRLAKKTTALYDKVSKSKLPHANWKIKDRFTKKLSIFSGVGIMKIWGESNPFKVHLTNIDHYDFHCEPGGGAILEDHLFMGEEGIYRSKEEMLHQAKNGVFNEQMTEMLVNQTTSNRYKDMYSQYIERLNRYRSLGLDPESHNYVGQQVFSLIEWYTTYKGDRYYCLFEENSMIAVRIERLEDMFSIVEPSDRPLWPYVSYHTHEDPKIFWSKAPSDDVRQVAITINKLINQQLYNRDKQNMGQRLYDPDMVKDVKSLGDWRVDGLTPVNTQNGEKNIARAVHRLDVGNLTGTVEFVEFLNQFAGQKTGSTPGSQGQAPSSQKVGIFYGEIQQISKRIGVYNASYREMWSAIGLRFRVALEDHLKDDKIQVKLMGATGIEWDEISEEDIKQISDFDITVEGGTESQAREEAANRKKMAGLKGVSTVNPKWRDIQVLKAIGFSDEEIKEAYALVDPGLKTLLSEAAQAEEDIVNGKDPELNRGANAAFMQHIVDFATDLSMDDKKKEAEIAIKLMRYAERHATIAAENEARKAVNMINDAKARMTPTGDTVNPGQGNDMKTGGELDVDALIPQDKKMMKESLEDSLANV